MARPLFGSVLTELGGPRVGFGPSAGLIVAQADDPTTLAAYGRLRQQVFVDQQGLFAATDHDDVDDHPDTIVLVALSAEGEVLGGVRLAPSEHGPQLGWWTGSRLVAAPGAPARTGAALVRAACARAEAEGALRFDAVVQADKEQFFARLGWHSWGRIDHQGAPHVRMRWPIGGLAALAAAKRVIGDVLGGLRPGGEGFVGDDGVPVPGSDLIAATDAILPSMVERDPWWAGWCSVLVNANDLAAMGATPVGLLDTVAAPTRSLAQRVMAGLAEAADRYGVPVLGGHTQVGVPAALSVTMLGRTSTAAPAPVPGGGGRVGDAVSVVADLAGSWRPGYGGRQWDSTTTRSTDEIRRLGSTLQRMRPRAAKDVSMAGLVGTLAMLAEASGTGAELDVDVVPRPDAAGLADWLGCFPGFALVLADDAATPAAGCRDVYPATAATCGRLVARPGVRLRWPDGELTPAVDGPVLGLGPAHLHRQPSQPTSDPGQEERS
jgi:putative N-acetyltransferase (TIGR04045 family)